MSAVAGRLSHGTRLRLALFRLDPRAQAISPGTDFTYSVVHDPSFEWSDAALSFTPPGAEKAVVYEMHIPTFNQQNGQAGARSGGNVDSTPVLTHSLAFLLGVCYVLLRHLCQCSTTTAILGSPGNHHD